MSVTMSEISLTGKVKSFYNETPFPNYDDVDTVGDLIRKAQRSQFAQMLDEQVPLKAKVLECGCGTGQLSNFLSVKGRDVVAADLSMSALKLGQQFARSQSLETVNFINMDLFSLPVLNDTFDLVISNGVIHHTNDPRGALKSLGRLVKPGGYISIGLYHYWGRIITDIRRLIFRHSGLRFKFLDPNLRGEKLTIKQKSWFNDQYCHPHESKHTIRETYSWFEDAGFNCVRSIPSTKLWDSLSPDEPLFKDQDRPSSVEALLKEMSFILNGSKEGGFFIVIARKRG